MKILIYYGLGGYYVREQDKNWSLNLFHGNNFEGVISAVLYSINHNNSKSYGIKISEEAEKILGYQTSRTLERIVKHHELFRDLNEDI